MHPYEASILEQRLNLSTNEVEADDRLDLLHYRSVSPFGGHIVGNVWCPYLLYLGILEVISK